MKKMNNLSPKEVKEVKSVKYDWPPLESDPEIFNEYFHNLGLKKTAFFKEMLSLTDYKEFLSINGPIIGVILNFSRTDKKNDTIPVSNILPTDKMPFYMKQISDLDAACGVIAALHAFGNSNLIYEKNSVLEEFFEKSKGMNYVERAEFLNNNVKFKKAHTVFAGKGQTSIENETKNDYVGHYVCFVNWDNKLIELDGMKNGPVVLKEGITWENYLDETMKIIMQGIEYGLIKEQVSVMLVADENSQLVDLLAG